MGLPKPSGPFVVGCADIMTKVVQMPTNLTCPSSVLEKGKKWFSFTPGTELKALYLQLWQFSWNQ